MNLRFKYMTASFMGVNDHAQKKMKELGITYQHAIPQTMGDQWWFLNCENVPSELPKYITEIEMENPFDFVGWGLNEKMAQDVIDFRNSKLLAPETTPQPS